MAEEKKGAIWSGDTLYNVLLKDLKTYVTYNVVTTWYDGTTMTDAKCDDSIYVKYEGKYLLQNLGDYGQVLQKDTMALARALSDREILLLKMGYYKHVQLNGYYKKGDTPAPIEYTLSATSETDDGFSVISVGGVKLEHKFNILDPLYAGAKGDGVSDDSDFLLKALNKEVEILNSYNTFKVTKQLGITGKKVNISKLNVKLTDIPNNQFGFIFSELPLKSGLVNNSSNINELSRTITLDDASDINPNDILVLKCIPQTTGSITIGKQYVITSAGGNFASVGASNNNVGTSFIATSSTPDYGTGGALLVLWDYDPRPGESNVTIGETVKVSEVSGNTITLDKPINKQFLSTYKVEYVVYRPKELNIHGLRLHADSAGVFGGIVVSFKNSPNISGCYMSKVSGSAGLSINYCYNASVYTTEISDGFYTGTPTGYGIQDNGSNGTVISNGCLFVNNRRGVDFSGVIPSTNGYFGNSIVQSNDAANNAGSCVGTHGGADLTTFENNIYIGGIIGGQYRSPRVLSKGNKFIGQTICCHSTEYNDSVTTIGETMEKSNNYSNLATGHYVQIGAKCKFSKNKPLNILNNSVEELRVGLVNMSFASPISLSGFVIGDNNIVLRSNANENNVGYFVNAGAGLATIRDSNIYRNQIRTITGVYKVGHNVVFNQDYNKGDVIRQFVSADLQTWSESPGVLSDVDIDVVQKTIENNYVNINGTLSFTISGGTALIVLKNAVKSQATIGYLKSLNNDILRVDNAGSIYIGYRTGTDYNTPFPAGSYTVAININYKINPSFVY